jgi:hypothetical protein
MNNKFLLLLTTSLIIMCLIGIIMTINSDNQGIFIGGLMVGCFWLGAIPKNKNN